MNCGVDEFEFLVPSMDPFGDRGNHATLRSWRSRSHQRNEHEDVQEVYHWKFVEKLLVHL